MRTGQLEIPNRSWIKSPMTSWHRGLSAGTTRDTGCQARGDEPAQNFLFGGNAPTLAAGGGVFGELGRSSPVCSMRRACRRGWAGATFALLFAGAPRLHGGYVGRRVRPSCGPASACWIWKPPTTSAASRPCGIGDVQHHDAGYGLVPPSCAGQIARRDGSALNEQAQQHEAFAACPSRTPSRGATEVAQNTRPTW